MLRFVILVPLPLFLTEYVFYSYLRWGGDKPVSDSFPVLRHVELWTGVDWSLKHLSNVIPGQFYLTPRHQWPSWN